MQHLVQLFATLLDYPSPALPDVAQECADLVAPLSVEAADIVGDFQSLAASTDLGRMEEIYTGFFELNAMAYPYVGYHLFGETYKRSVFLLGLQECYAAHNYTHGVELADHLVVILRFVAECPDEAAVDELVNEALLPTLAKMAGTSAEDEVGETESVAFQRGYSVYQRLLHALQLTLEALRCEAVAT